MIAIAHPMANMRAIVPLAACFGVLACASPPKPAEVPNLPRAADLETRERFYDDYKLTEQSGKWSRKDGEYKWQELEQVAHQYPASGEIYDRATSRASVIGGLASVGGGIVGGTFGWNLGASAENRMSSGTQLALYGLGGAIILAGIIAVVTWHDPAKELADTYNRELKIDLRFRDEEPKQQSAFEVPRCGIGEQSRF
jgi:hypothetical protein